MWSLVLLGTLMATVISFVVGWIGGRIVGVAEGAHQERRRIRRDRRLTELALSRPSQVPTLSGSCDARIMHLVSDSGVGRVMTSAGL